MTKREEVARIVRGWLVPMVKTLPHRLASRMRDADDKRQEKLVEKLRRQDRPGLLARKSLGFRSLTDMRRNEVEQAVGRVEPASGE
ncbi:MAG: hypothetical protein KC431_21180 [Myxococcales bacterium]|nr:hypothetical protein [Myxococcales bacterium]